MTPTRVPPFQKDDIFDSFEDATGQLTDLVDIDKLKTKDVKVFDGGFTEKWVGLNPKTGEWHSAFFNPTTKKFSGGKYSSRND